MGYVEQRAAALRSQVKDLDATCDSDPSLQGSGNPVVFDRAARHHRPPGSTAVAFMWLALGGQSPWAAWGTGSSHTTCTCTGKSASEELTAGEGVPYVIDQYRVTSDGTEQT